MRRPVTPEELSELEHDNVISEPLFVTGEWLGGV